MGVIIEMAVPVRAGKKGGSNPGAGLGSGPGADSNAGAGSGAGAGAGAGAGSVAGAGAGSVAGSGAGAGAGAWPGSILGTGKKVLAAERRGTRGERAGGKVKAIDGSDLGDVEMVMVARKPIKDWVPEEQPRERMVMHRSASLSQAELLAILIRQGSQKHSALELARQLLDRYGDIHTLGKCTPGDLMKFPGIGIAKATTILAGLELGRRLREERLPERYFIRSSRDSANYARPWLEHLPHEAFAVMYLVQAGWVKAFDVVSKGGINSTTVDARPILKRALEEGAVSIIAFHNHPSGSLRPSKSDDQLTQKLSQAARTMDIKLLDHVIIGEGGYFSFADEGLLH